MKFAFWEGWYPQIRSIFFVILALVMSAIVYGIICDFLGYNLILDWEVLGQRSVDQVVAGYVQLGPEMVPLIADNYVISEWYRGGEMQINEFAYYFHLILITIAIVLGLTASTYYNRIWYVVISAAVIAIFIFMKLDGLGLFGLYDNTVLILVLVSFLGISYYFQAVRTEMPFLKRLQAFSGLAVVWGLLIYFFAEIPMPFLFISGYGFLVPFLIGIIFIFAVSNEIVHFLAIAVGRDDSQSGSSLTHFTIFSLVYLANIVVLYLYDTRVISWDFYYLNPYVLLAVSAILALWGLKSRSAIIDSDENRFPLLVLLFLAMGLCCFGTMALFLGTRNDVILQVLKDAIIYSHLGFGFIFFIYIISNFLGMMRSGLKIGRVVYKPKNMPHFTFRFAGLILVTALVLKENVQVPIYQTLSGMFNNIGEYYSLTGNSLERETFFENGALYGYQNHKSNYVLGKIADQKADIATSIESYERATGTRPSEMAFVNLSETWRRTPDFFRSLFALNSALEVFPSSGPVLNNKGVLFSQTDMVDSALLYFDAAFRAGDKKAISSSNFIASLDPLFSNFNADSVFAHYDVLSSLPGQANAFKVLNDRPQFNADLGIIPFVPDKDDTLNVYSASWLVNYMVNQYQNIDSAYYSRVDSVSNLPQNFNYRQSVDMAIAISCYKNGLVDRAFDKLIELSTYFQDSAPRYYHTLGLLLADLRHYREAVEYFDLSWRLGFEPSYYLMQLCQMEAGIGIDGDSLDHRIRSIMQLSDLTVEMVSDSSDTHRIAYLLAKKARGQLTAPDLTILMETMENEEKRVGTLSKLFEEYYNQGDRESANDVITLLRQSSYSDLRKEIALLDWLAWNKDLSDLEADLEKTKWLPVGRKWYYEALVDTKSDTPYLIAVTHCNSFNERAIILASRYFEIEGQDLQSYNILTNALRHNRYSPVLLKEYVRLALEEGFRNYALSGLEELSKLIDNEAYRSFEKEVLQALKDLDD